MFFKDFIKNPQTTIALIFLTHIISDIDGVSPHVIYASSVIKAKQNKIIQNWFHPIAKCCH